MKKIFTLVILFTLLNSYGQKFEKNSIQFQYKQLPEAPLDKSITAYDSKVILNYTEEINKRLQDAEIELQERLAEYPEDLAYAREKHDESLERFDKQMEEWKKTDLGTKFIEKQILKEDNKPRKPGAFYPPPKPTIRYVEHQKIFDENNLSSTYLKIDGYKSGTENALKITATLMGFEYQEIESKTVTQKKYNSSTKSYSNVTTTTYTLPYKHSINLKIETPDGQVLHDGFFNQQGEYKNLKTTVYPSNLRNLEESSVRDNMTEIKNYLISQYGFPKLSYNMTFKIPTSKKLDYSDYQDAFLAASEGYSLLIEDKEDAFKLINDAIIIWEKAMTESDIENRKARINLKVTNNTLGNLYNAYLWTHNYEKVKEISKKMLGKNTKKKFITSYQSRTKKIKELQKRFDANEVLK